MVGEEGRESSPLSPSESKSESGGGSIIRSDVDIFLVCLFGGGRRGRGWLRWFV